MDRTIASLAILKVNWDHLKKDYIESFVPFVATLITRKKYKKIDANIMSSDFAEEYGLIIPYHPMVTILNRAKKRGVIKKNYEGKFVPVKEEISKIEFSAVSTEQQRKQKKVIREVIKFSKDEYDIELTEEEAGSAFISYLKTHDLEILFASQEEDDDEEEKSILPEVQSPRKHRFIINSFIRWAYKSEHETFIFIVDIAIGHTLASTLLYSKFEKFSAKVKGLSFYFDTGFILGLLGIEGNERKDGYVAFLKALSEEGANLFIFRHNYDETVGILERCMHWVQNTDYDLSKANHALIYFVDNGYSVSDVETFIVNAKGALEENSINIAETPDPNKDKIYQIDETKLRDHIVKVYKKKRPLFDEEEKDYTIQKDISSISTVYKLRKGLIPQTLKEAKHIFVTTNGALAYANRVFDICENGDRFCMPASLTDIFVGTLVWLQSPAKVLLLNEKKIIADSYAALQPDRILITKYKQEVEKLKDAGKITDDQYYLLRTSRVARNLLEEKTLGDPDTFTDRTSLEILDEIMESIKGKETQKYLEEKQGHEKSRIELAAVKREKEGLEQNIEKWAERISTIVARGFYAIFTPLVLLVAIIAFYPEVFENSKALKRILILAILFITVLNIVYGFHIKGLGEKIKKWTKDTIIQLLRAKGGKK